jgi:hypothetical protein
MPRETEFSLGHLFVSLFFLLLRYVLVTDTLITPSQLQSGKSRARIHNTHISSKFRNGPNKLVLNYTRLKKLVGDKQFSLLGPFVSEEEK